MTRLELHQRGRAVLKLARKLLLDLQEHRAAGCAVDCCLDALADEELDEFLTEVEAVTDEVLGARWKERYGL